MQEASTPETLTTFIGSVTSLQKTLDAILPVSGACSETAPTTQLRATLNDMLTVDAAFARMPGTPDKIKSGIQKAMAKIKAAQEGSSNITTQTKAMKGDLTKKMAARLAEKIDQIGTDPNHELPDAEKAELCGAYADIATDVSASVVCSGGAVAAP